MSSRNVYPVALAILFAIFVSLYPYPAGGECGTSGCPQPSHAAPVACPAVCAVGAVLAATVSAFDLAAVGVPRAADQARPPQLYPTPEPPPPRRLRAIHQE